MSRPFALRIIALLSILLLGGVTLGGSALGYECRCTGRAVLVAVDHCHGPHGEGCLDGDATHGDHCGAFDENTEHHTAVQKDADGLPPTVSASPSAVPALVAVLPADAGWDRRSFPTGSVAQKGSSACRPPPSIEAARTVALLI